MRRPNPGAHCRLTHVLCWSLRCCFDTAQTSTIRLTIGVHRHQFVVRCDRCWCDECLRLLVVLTWLLSIWCAPCFVCVWGMPLLDTTACRRFASKFIPAEAGLFTVSAAKTSLLVSCGLVEDVNLDLGRTGFPTVNSAFIHILHQVRGPWTAYYACVGGTTWEHGRNGGRGHFQH